MTDVEAPPIEELIPHRGESILLDRVIDHDRESTTAVAVVGGHRWLRQPDGSVAAWLAIEYMAQCVAAHEGMLARADGRTLPLGFLVGATGLRLGASRFRGDEQLRVRVRRIRGRPGLGVLAHACAIFIESDDPNDPNGEPVAEGRLSIVVESS